MPKPTLRQQINQTNRIIAANQLRLNLAKHQLTPQFFQSKYWCFLFPALGFSLGWFLSGHMQVKKTLQPIWRFAKAEVLNLMLWQIK